MKHNLRNAAALVLAHALFASAAHAQTPPASTPAPAPAPLAPVAPAAPAPAATEPTLTPAPAPAVTQPWPADALASAAATEEPEAAPAKVGYEKGFFIESGDGNHRLAIQGRVQSRYQYQSVEDGPDTSAFSVERAHLKLDGHAFTKDLTFLFQTDFGKGNVRLKDYYGDYRFIKNVLHLRAGQWKKPFSRQQIASSGSQELVDRAITDRAFGTGRDIGLALHNDYEKSPSFEYALGLFNGTGDRGTASAETEISIDPDTGDITAETSAGTPSNVPSMFNPALVARVGYNHNGIKGYSEVDLEGGDFRFAVGASGQIHFDADRDDESFVRAELDAMVKVQGLSLSGAGYVSSEQAGAGFGDRALEAIGFHLQGSYLFAETFAPALRVAVLAPDGNKDDELELALGVGYFPFGHNVKWQTEIAALRFQDTHTTDARLRTQLQLAF
jgi:phosphate-selective porin OprO/OprP